MFLCVFAVNEKSLASLLVKTKPAGGNSLFSNVNNRTPESNDLGSSAFDPAKFDADKALETDKKTKGTSLK